MVELKEKKIILIGDSYAITIPKSLIKLGIIDFSKPIDVELTQKGKNAFFRVLPQKIKINDGGLNMKNDSKSEYYKLRISGLSDEEAKEILAEEEVDKMIKFHGY